MTHPRRRAAPGSLRSSARPWRAAAVVLSAVGALLGTTATPAPVGAEALAPPAASAPAAEGTYGAPVWLPLRRDLAGTEVTVGCTYESHGSQHGYECGGHHGRWAIDFIAEPGTPVFAAGAGFATDITGKSGGGGFGNVVRIDHGFGTSTVYAHLTEAMVPAEGTWVDETTQIGTVGSTGSSSTPHLHYERFALPGPGAAPGSEVSVDPGPLWACRGDLLVSFPQVAGIDSWQGLPWGALTVASDGSACLEAALDPDRTWAAIFEPVLDLADAALALATA